MNLTLQEQSIIDQAKIIMQNSAIYTCDNAGKITSCRAAAELMRLTIGVTNQEKFAVALLNQQHRVISCEVLFIGTINSASVYPRDIAAAALKSDAVAVIIAHNHPSGLAEPSSSDLAITKAIKAGLNLFDIQLLDHIIVAGDSHYSFAANTLI
jgi:DNA repair protein RadC